MKSVIVKETFKAPAHRVWEALTNASQLKQWYFDIGEFKAEVGFEFTFMGQGVKGTPYKHLCKVTAVIPQKKLQYSWEYENMDGYSVVTFELQEENDITHLTLTHSGLETFPGDHPDFRLENFQNGWKQLVKKQLQDFLSGEKV